MAINLKDLKSAGSTLPPRILLHGVAGIGKTSLAAEFPDAVLLDTEEGAPMGMSIPSSGLQTSYKGVVDFMGALAQQEHAFKTLIIDSLDGLEPLIWRETCVRNGGWESIETPGYGKGYLLADATWLEFVAGCDYLRRERGMTIIWIAHSAVDRFDAPGAQPYSRYDLRLHKRGSAIMTDRADHIFFVNTKTDVKEVEVGFNKKHAHAEGGGARWIFTDARPAFIAKNRATNMPPQLLYQKGRGYADLAPFLFPGAPKPAAAPAEKPARKGAAATTQPAETAAA
ncbi:MAG: ATP-binding protein [Beijerinckiaceae bacterium]|nr:ATP-binding protein [Beijerinckiaceae bacterium]